MRSSRNILLAGSSLLGLVAGFAATPGALADTTISGTTAGYSWSTGNLAVTNTGSITGIAGSTSAALTVGSSASVGTLSNSGVINGAISSSTTAYGPGISSAGVIRTLSNSGTISGCSFCAGLSNAGSIGTLANSGSISSYTGVLNTGSIGTLANSGSITGGTLGGVGIYNGVTANATGTISLLSNSGSISGQSGLLNGGRIGTLANSGKITGSAYAIVNETAGSIGTIANTGTINGTVDGVLNHGSIAALLNSGVITGSGSTGIAIANSGSIGTIVNQAGATISGADYAIANSGTSTSTIGTVTSTSGSNGTIGLIIDSGVIAGNIDNASTSSLTITGASGSSYGTLTGYSSGSAGTITSTNANLVFSSGNILLNDSVNVGSYSVVNSGATIQVTSASTITGNYTQTGGGLVVVASNSGTSYNSLVVSGNATVTGSTIIISGSSLTKGETFVVVNPSGTGSYSNDTVSVTGTAGLTGSVTSVGSEMVVTLSTLNYTSIASQAGSAGSSMGNFLNTAVNSSGTVMPWISNEVTYLATLSTAQQATAIKQLAPSQMTPAAVASTAITTTTSAIGMHQMALNDGGTGAGAAAGSASHDYALWGQFLGGTATRSTSATADGFRSHNFGLMSGFDYLGDRDVTVGAALSWVRGWNWGAGDSTGNFAQSDAYQVTGYGTRRWDAAFVDTQLSLGYTTTNQRRLYNLGQEAAHSNYDSRLYVAKVDGGYDFPVESVTLTPMIGWQFARVASGGYQETGSGDAWKVKAADVHTWTQELGGRVSWNVATPWGNLMPEAKIAWVHDYNQAATTTNATQSVTVALAQGAGNNVTTRIAADGARFSAAAELKEVGDLTLRLEYDGELRPGYQSHAGLVKASIGF